MQASTGATSGSSPHVRGALWPRVSGRASIGIIPACAGSTLGMGNWCRFRWDHPRMCGEHKSMAFCVGTLRGSSPHVRGALVWSCPYCGHSGIIPACAGSTRYSTTGKQGRRDHPRMCGEHGGVNNYNNPTLGSSPHVRGAHVRTLIVPACGGIIPACTGSTTTSSRTRTGRWDHPRMCGEHFDEWIDDMSATGSSPHVRGAPCCLVRTTPSWGSSPHVRGAHLDRRLPRRESGIIPACAGSTVT